MSAEPLVQLSKQAWQRAYGAPLGKGVIRQQAEDFRVSEIAGFEPDGAGEHDFLKVQKTGANTAWVASRLAQFAGVRSRDVGFSGLKDRHAVTEQWFSVLRRPRSDTDWNSFEHPDITILDIRRNSRKLRRGAHAANRFSISVRQCDLRSDDVAERLRKIAAGGVPNYFGEQRFGRDGSNLARAQALLQGRRLKREQRSMALSAARSLLFNLLLDRAVDDGSWVALDPGGRAQLDGSNSHFAVDTVDASLESRLAALDIHPVLPLWGSGVDECYASRLPVDLAEFATGINEHSDAAFRATRLAVNDLDWSIEDDNLNLQFELSRGGFATAVLREIVDYRDLQRPDT